MAQVTLGDFAPVNKSIWAVNNSTETDVIEKEKVEGVVELYHDTDGVRGVGRNLLEITAESGTVNGISCTVDKESGTIFIPGGQTGIENNSVIVVSYIEYGSNHRTHINEKYIISGCPEGGSTDSYWVQANYYSSANTQAGAIDIGEGAEYTSLAEGGADVYIIIKAGYTIPADGLLFKPMIRSAKYADDPTFYPYSQPEIEFQQWTRNIITKKLAPVFGFRISDSESDPSSKVTPLVDAVGMTPAKMNYTSGVFDYGSWGDVWFVEDTKPCILNQDRTIQHYLNKNNYAKNLAGDDVTIDENLTGANVMIEFPKIWYKVVPDSTGYSADIYLSPVKVDDDFVDYAYIDYQGLHKEHFYMPAYNGSLINDVLRSVSGQAVMYSKTAQQEIDYAKANGAGWYTEDVGEIQLINFLLMQMGMSTDTQTVFGRGIDSGSDTVMHAYRTGAGNTKGMFWGNNDGTQLVKVFGIENWWALQWRRYAGDVLDNGKRLIKLCYGNEDGSTVTDFNIDGSGYVDVGVTPSGTSGGYISRMKFTKSGVYSAVSSGSASTHYCDGQWFNNAYHTIYAFRGGDSADGLLCGALYVHLGDAPGAASWTIGAAPSCK